jgi:hypothetical protein
MKTTELWRDRWTAGWSSLVPFQLNGVPHLLSYKIGDGTVAIDRFNPDGKATTELWRDTWTAGWSSLVPFQLNGVPHLLSYKIGDGTVAIDRIDPD